MSASWNGRKDGSRNLSVGADPCVGPGADTRVRPYNKDFRTASSCLCVLIASAIALGLASVTLRAGPQTPTISFTRTVYPIFESAQCRGCHSDDGVASATRVHFPEPNASPDEIEAFGLTLAALVDRADPARSLLINKPTNRVRHTGGVRIQPGSFDEEALRTWVQYLAGVSEEVVTAARERVSASNTASAPDQLLRA